MKTLALAWLAMAALAGCEDKPVRGTATGKAAMTAHCVGRTVISLPSSYTLADGSTGNFIPEGHTEQDADIWVVVYANKVTAVQFKEALAKHREQLLEKSSTLTLEQDFDSRGTLFRTHVIDDAYQSEIGFRIGSSFVVASMNSYRNTFSRAEDRLRSFVRTLQAAEHGPGRQPGYCLGPVKVTGNLKQESAKVLFRSTALQGTSFGVTTDTFQPDDEKPLLKRMSGPDTLMTIFDVGQTVLRERELQIGAVRAQEWLGYIKTKPNQGGKKYIFALETMRQTPSKAAPHLHLEFDTGESLTDGGCAPMTLTDADAMAMWDAVVSSISFTGRPDG